MILMDESSITIYRILDSVFLCRMNEVTRKAEDDIEVEGRIPTPVLRNLTTGEVPPRASRHHLDLTTPCIGGVLLSSSDNQVFTPKSSK